MYRTLNADKTVQTLRTLASRIGERFPNAGLHRVCCELVTIAEETCGKIASMSRANIGIRAGIAGLLVAAVAALLMTFREVRLSGDSWEFAEFVQVVEAGTNVIVLLGAGLFFLITLESRIKRGRVLKALHELRAVAHVIDMHQLTKDPSRILSAAHRTASSPSRNLTPFQLTRYLDYCSEMLSLIGKLAALYPQTISDAVIFDTVNDIESLTNGLSRKIWQKIMILEEEMRRAGVDATIITPEPAAEAAAIPSDSSVTAEPSPSPSPSPAGAPPAGAHGCAAEPADPSSSASTSSMTDPPPA